MYVFVVGVVGIIVCLFILRGQSIDKVKPSALVMSRHQFSPTPASPEASMTYAFTVTSTKEATQQLHLHFDAGVPCCMSEDYMNRTNPVNGKTQRVQIWHFFTAEA